MTRVTWLVSDRAETQVHVLVTSSYYYKFSVLISSSTFVSIECLLCLIYFLSDDRIGEDGICLFWLFLATVAHFL